LRFKHLLVCIKPGLFAVFQGLLVYVYIPEVLLDPLVIGHLFQGGPLLVAEEAHLLHGMDGLMPQITDWALCIYSQPDQLVSVLSIGVLQIINKVERNIAHPHVAHNLGEDAAKLFGLGLNLSV